MAAYERKPLVMEMEREEDFEEEASGNSGCWRGCFRGFRLKWWQSHEEEGRRLIEQNSEGGGETWMVEKMKKMKEVPEVIEWKNFIRKVSGYGKKQRKNRFQYDEQSYALNFNSGAPSEDDEDMPPSFSARFSAPGRHKNGTS